MKDTEWNAYLFLQHYDQIPTVGNKDRRVRMAKNSAAHSVKKYPNAFFEKRVQKETK